MAPIQSISRLGILKYRTHLKLLLVIFCGRCLYELSKAYSAALAHRRGLCSCKTDPVKTTIRKKGNTSNLLARQPLRLCSHVSLLRICVLALTFASFVRQSTIRILRRGQIRHDLLFFYPACCPVAFLKRGDLDLHMKGCRKRDKQEGRQQFRRELQLTSLCVN